MKLLDDAEQKQLVNILKAGIEWLDSEQDPKAVLSHHGISCKSPIGPLSISLAPTVRGGWPVLIFNHKDRYSEEWDGYTAGDVALIRALVELLVPVRTDWNGVGTYTYSVCIGHRAGEGIATAQKNYRDAGQRIFESGFWQENPIRVTKPEGWL